MASKPGGVSSFSHMANLVMLYLHIHHTHLLLLEQYIAVVMIGLVQYDHKTGRLVSGC